MYVPRLAQRRGAWDVVPRLAQGPAPTLLQQELRGAWLGRPARYHLLDFLGVALGSFFLWRSWRDRRPLAMGLGALMIVIHSTRFFYAPQDPAGVARLLRSVGLTWDDVCAIREGPR